MKTTIHSWLIGMAAFIAIPVKAQDNKATLDLTLEKAIEIALSENPTIKVADKDIQLKNIADKEAWQSLLPEVAITGGMTHTLLAAEMKLNGNSFKMGKDGTATGVAALNVNFPIFAPAVYQTMKITKTDIELSLEKARSSRLDLINQVTKAYYQTMLAQDSYNVMQQSLQTSEENYKVVKSKYEFGKVSEFDALTAEVQMRNTKSSMVSTKNALTLAALQLKVLMGVTADVNININDRLENYEDKLVLADITDPDRDLSNNTQMRQFDLNEKMLTQNRKLLKTNFLPTVGFALIYQYQSLYNENWNVFNYDWASSSNFQITFSIPIFRAGNWTKLKTNKLQMEQLQDSRLNTERQLTMAVQSYSTNMASSIEQVSSNRLAIEQAEKARMISTKRYEVGRGTVLEMNESEVALTQSKLTYNQSIYDYLTNKADLDYTLGKETYLK